MNNETLKPNNKHDPAPPPEILLPQQREEVLALLKTSATLYWEKLNPRNHTDVFLHQEQNGLTLDCIRKIEGTRFDAMLTKWTARFAGFFSVCTMNMEQLTETINLMVETYPNYAIADLKLFFKQAKNGTFGEVYGRFDGNVILSWMRKYDKNRLDALNAFNRSRRIEEETRKCRQWEAYARSEAFAINRKHAREGYLRLQKAIAESRFGPKGNRIPRLTNEE